MSLGDENASGNTWWLQDIRVLGSVWLVGYAKPVGTEKVE